MYDNISIEALITFIQNEMTKEDAKALKISYSKISKIKKKQAYIWRMNFKDITKINDYRVYKKKQRKNVEYVGIDIGTTHTLTASDIDMKRTLIIENKRIYNATKIYNQNYNNQNATKESIQNTKEMLVRTIESNVDKIINQLLNRYTEPVTFIVGEVYQSVENIRPHYTLYQIFLREMKKRAKHHDINVVSIDESYTSLVCPKCHYKDSKNRTNSNSFKCKQCDFVHDNDDVVASANIVSRYISKKRKNEAV